jgi:hypothetical protein
MWAVFYLVIAVVAFAACCVAYGLGVAVLRYGYAAIVKWRSKRSHSGSDKT